MWISKKEVESLSEYVRGISSDKDIRDNKEGVFSILKNDIYTLVNQKDGQIKNLEEQRDVLAEYMADISHQLKTPITSMMIMTDLIEGAEPDKRSEFVHNIKVSLNKMEWLVGSILKMAKLDTKAVEFNKTTVSLSELIGKIRPSVDILLDINSQSLELVNDCSVVCDKRWTAEALTNLVKNGIEHSPNGGKIWIDGGDNPLYWWISVKDSGAGLNRSTYAAMFKRFEHSTKENGYGIGMPLALSIVKGQGGDIDVDFGGNGTGATFTMKFFK